MELVKEIEKLLESLKKMGIDRGDIEKDLTYSENYIDQTLSRGGNKRFLAALKRYHDEAKSRMMEKKDHAQSDIAKDNIEEPAPEVPVPVGWLRDVINQLLESNKTLTKTIAANLEDVTVNQKADHSVMMRVLDQMAKRSPGTLAKESDIVATALRNQLKKGDKSAFGGK